MSNINVNLNQIAAWTSDGTSDVVTFNIMREQGSKGFQIETDGLALEDLTITAFGHTGASKIVDVDAGTGELGFIGLTGASLSKITISGAAAGTYKVKLTEL